MRHVAGLAVLAVTAGCLHRGGPSHEHDLQTTEDSEFARAMRESMEKMDRDMMAAPMTGDPDHDFAAMMIPHHRGAIDMAMAYLPVANDPVLRRLAQEILVTQAQEIEVMRLRLAPSTPTPTRWSPQIPPEDISLALGSGCDRVYTADQTSNTVSVVDPDTNRLLGVLRLGEPVPGALSPLYRGQLLVHGLGFSPDHRTLAVVSIGSNSVTFVDTATNEVQGVVYVGRSPHEAFFTPDGSELWVAVRGEDYVSVVDPVEHEEIRRIETADGPGMVLFRPDGRYAFVPSSFTPELDVVDTRSYEVVARIPQASPFSPNLSVSRDGSEVWFTLKDSGKTQVMSGEPPFRILHTLDTGPITNHVTLVDNAAGSFAYVTVGGENAVEVYRRGAKPKRIATIPTGDLPHGVWGSDDGGRVYVGLENQDAVVAIDTTTNRIVATIPIGQQPQALVYVPDAVPDCDGTRNLTPLGEAGQAAHLALGAPDPDQSTAHATVSVNMLGPLDLLQIAVTDLEPNTSYTLWLVSEPTAPFGQRQALATFETNVAGAQVAQTIGPLRQVLTATEPDPTAPDQRFLVVTPADSEQPVLVQAD